MAMNPLGLSFLVLAFCSSTSPCLREPSERTHGVTVVALSSKLNAGHCPGPEALKLLHVSELVEVSLLYQVIAQHPVTRVSLLSLALQIWH